MRLVSFLQLQAVKEYGHHVTQSIYRIEGMIFCYRVLMYCDKFKKILYV
jgi:hypothetical protein